MNDTELKEGMMVADRYRLKKYVGSGSFGEVWLATDTEMELDLAIKLYISLDKTAQDEFKNEYRVVYGLKEEHLLTADYYGVWEHRPFLTMKYCSRGSAAKIAGSADEATVWQFLHDVAAGLRYLHSLEPPILHQDIKPENILADDRGNFIITDFGISRKMRSTMRKQSKRSVGSGALAYMGPERFLNDPMAVKASDIWSLGVSAYELATGDLPFMGQGGGMMLGGAQLPSLNPDKWSRDLNECIQACMAKDTWERPTAEQLVEYTDLILSGHKIPWGKWFKQSNSAQSSDKPSKNKPAQIQHNGGGRKAMFVVLSIIAVLALGAGLYWFFVMNNPAAGGSADDEEVNQTEIISHYNELQRVCAGNIKRSDHNSYGLIIDARQLLDSIDDYRSRYSFIAEDPDKDPASLRADYDRKASQIHDRYMRSASGLINAGEYPTATEYLQIAGLMVNDASVRQELDRVAHLVKTPAVFMAVKNASIDGSNLTLSYDNLNTSRIKNVDLRYDLTDAAGSTVSGQATIDIEKGADNIITISLPQGIDPSLTPVQVKITSRGAFVSRYTIE